MTEMNNHSVWERLDDISEDELAYLTNAALAVIADHSSTDIEGLTKLPHNATVDQARSALAEEGIDVDESGAATIVSDPQLDRSMALSLLRATRESPLRDEIERVYRQMRDMMILDAGLLLGGAVLILVLKLKRIKIGDNEVEFYEAKSEVLEAIRTFLGSR
jgi:hypothetical protein